MGMLKYGEVSIFQVILESLRMASIISFTFREAVVDVEYKGKKFKQDKITKALIFYMVNTIKCFSFLLPAFSLFSFSFFLFILISSKSKNIF